MKTPYPLPSRSPYTALDVKKFFRAAGVPLADWAKTNGFAPHEVYAVLGGQAKGTRGRSHEIALKLGMKLPVEKICA
ncbi:MAG: DNA-binding protein [Rhodospirillaceae bacterium]|nr:DNA-binding protein [Rhodospirillaceae bacterium]